MKIRRQRVKIEKFDRAALIPSKQRKVVDTILAAIQKARRERWRMFFEDRCEIRFSPPTLLEPPINESMCFCPITLACYLAGGPVVSSGSYQTALARLTRPSHAMRALGNKIVYAADNSLYELVADVRETTKIGSVLERSMRQKLLIRRAMLAAWKNG